jgi:hypothetical protein
MRGTYAGHQTRGFSRRLALFVGSGFLGARRTTLWPEAISTERRSAQIAVRWGLSFVNHPDCLRPIERQVFSNGCL